jgi:hypothetical protein
MLTYNPAADNVGENSVRLHFSVDDFWAERFLSNFQSDVESITWCIKSALAEQPGIDCKPVPFCFGDYSVDENDRWAWTIVDLHVGEDAEASFVVSARQESGVNLYSFEADNGVVEDVRLEQSGATVMEFLIQDVLSQLGCTSR